MLEEVCKNSKRLEKIKEFNQIKIDEKIQEKKLNFEKKKLEKKKLLLQKKKMEISLHNKKEEILDKFRNEKLNHEKKKSNIIFSDFEIQQSFLFKKNDNKKKLK